jgi:hypothetical protein
MPRTEQIYIYRKLSWEEGALFSISRTTKSLSTQWIFPMTASVAFVLTDSDSPWLSQFIRISLSNSHHHPISPSLQTEWEEWGLTAYTACWKINSFTYSLWLLPNLTCPLVSFLLCLLCVVYTQINQQQAVIAIDCLAKVLFDRGNERKKVSEFHTDKKSPPGFPCSLTRTQINSPITSSK